ncbi:N-acetyltransferase [Mesorhizobium sp. CAU 1732]|uniref:N-acetyltransferase n=1 Tax=Mesorhizobium sp. CAU 1732 TaxID=3140358 RepID=UPI00325FECED
MSIETATQMPGSHGLPHTLNQLGQRIRGRLKPQLATRIERYGLRRDLTVPVEPLNAKIPLSCRRMTASDVEALLPDDVSALSRSDQLEVTWRRIFIDKVGIANGSVAVDERDGTPCYVQWLFGHADNHLVRRVGGFPDLGPEDALLENAYTPRSYRGLGVLPVAGNILTEKAVEFGARYVHTFIGVANRAALKGARRIGYEPHMLHTQRFRLFGLLKDDHFDIMQPDDPRRRWEL